jgi:predicted transcriptional regulator of viral defense system
MKNTDMIRMLRELDKRGLYVLARRDIEKMVPDESEKTIERSLQRLVEDGLLVRAARGVYVNPVAVSRDGWVIERIAKALRPGCHSYVSLESMLSEWGVISQIPIGWITIMTTGAGGTFNTPYGTIEFTHTRRSLVDIMAHTVTVPNRPLPIATKRAAIRDLVRVGRNVNMIDPDELSDDSNVV